VEEEQASRSGGAAFSLQGRGVPGGRQGWGGGGGVNQVEGCSQKIVCCVQAKDSTLFVMLAVTTVAHTLCEFSLRDSALLVLPRANQATDEL